MPKVRHNHVTRDIKLTPGVCPACDMINAVRVLEAAEKSETIRKKRERKK